jgi:hypothetical protein
LGGRNFDCVTHCVRMAEATYDLAVKAELPEIIGDYLNIAGKLLACAEREKDAREENAPGRKAGSAS